ncbi:D-serine ammonia-lyase [Prosthecomicrobium hirschii]|uniref:D-serine ammonia-lyase n=1 Tax=Prosthecodimorpha hirschii TaxID=665126 RepID=UPI000A7E6AEC|nr:D-serine ammonia-lyase [Prosthecomicrobium hirschii]
MNTDRTRIIHGRSLADWIAEFPPIADLVAARETAWFNPAVAPAAEALGDVGLGLVDVRDAEARLRRFAPLLARLFPELAATGGIIESDLVAAPAFAAALAAEAGTAPAARILIKKDSHLPVSGSIKARGGFYEVLKRAETLAEAAGLIGPDGDTTPLAEPAARDLFARHAIAVGSTGNLGLSIGLMGARLGFRTTVHMSADARAWKKAKLRAAGVAVVEHAADYGAAVAQGRAEAAADPSCHFVDDEHSQDLFLGYAVAALRLAPQLAALGIAVDGEHPLFVHLPCGVGGGPGGVAFGLKLVYGDAVHCLFAEPTASPAMLLGVLTDRHDAVAVQDFGLSNLTAADGLAVGRPSGFVGRALRRLVDGYFTVADRRLFRLLALLKRTEGLELEPSAIAGAPGPAWIAATPAYRARMALTPDRLARATHILWATGGSMVPPDEMAGYLTAGEEALRADGL